ncbi:hypothetical protein BDQ17DRAFT_1336253 [Cyathus striatus]|nr:hypothetical protein BDQ17DRAFT_1336253 [Cyathus striatus]
MAEYFPEEMQNAIPIIIGIASNEKRNLEIHSVAMKALAHLLRSFTLHVWINNLEALVLGGNTAFPLEKILEITVDDNNSYDEAVQINAIQSLAKLANSDNDDWSVSWQWVEFFTSLAKKVAWTDLKLQTILLSKSITQDLSCSTKGIITVSLVNLFIGDIDANKSMILDLVARQIGIGLRDQNVDIHRWLLSGTLKKIFFVKGLQAIL